MDKNYETISVPDLRNSTRAVIENAYSRNRRYVVERAGRPMVVIVGVEDFQRMITTVSRGEPTVAGRTSMPSL